MYKLVIIHDEATQTFTIEGFCEVKEINPFVTSKWSKDGARITRNSIEEVCDFLRKNYK